MKPKGSLQLFSQSIRLLLILFFVNGVVICSLLTLFYQNEAKKIIENIKAQEQNRVELQKQLLSSVFSNLFTDLLFFREQNELHHYLNKNNTDYLKEIQA